jgi:hypothetical protein
MNSRRLTYLLVRTLIFFVAALVVAVLWHWTPVAIIAVALTGAATAVQLGGVLWLRRAERNAADADSRSKASK